MTQVSLPERDGQPVHRHRVYRAGLMTPGVGPGPHVSLTAAADRRRPSPAHPPRLGSLFASPTLPGVVRWVLGNHMCRYETKVREITVDANTTWIYRVDAWERIRDERDTERINAYWGTGMLLSEWLAVAEAEGLDASDWEVLIRPEDVLGVRNVSAARLLTAAPEWRLPELKRILREWRYAA